MCKLKSTLLVMLVFVMATSIVACTSQSVNKESDTAPKESVQKPLIKGAPEWVSQGSGGLIKNDQLLIRGVAFAEPMGDMAQQKAYADDRARAEIEKVFNAYLSELDKSYHSRTKQSATDASFLQVLKPGNGNRKFLALTRISGSWRDLQTNTMWSVAEMDIRQAGTIMLELDELGPDMKEFLRASADNVFDRFIKERK